MSMHTNSANARLAAMKVGERTYAETDVQSWAKHMRQWIGPRTRRPPELAGMEFKSKLFTAVPATDIKDIRYLICIERTR